MILECIVIFVIFCLAFYAGHIGYKEIIKQYKYDKEVEE